MESKVTVSGNIIGELSEKIPSNIIALNELIKNAYDAGASCVEIILDSASRKLIIKDNGEGMNKSDIDTLFHISNSTKVYGSVNEKYNRYVQGAKGLGFLSVFKFGHKVQWETKKDKGYRFFVDYDDLKKQHDISEYSIELTEDDEIKEGTRIEINIDEYNVNSLLEYFEEEKNYKKVINAFNDNTFEIILNVNGTKHKSSEMLDLKKNAPGYVLYNVLYKSEDKKIRFFYNNHLIMEEQFVYDSSKYKLAAELVIFQLAPYVKNGIDKLYWNPRNDLTPLIFVNDNLFNNYDLFEPNIMKNIKNDLVLNQMIGKIEIISDDKDINFNSDRSQFLQNELTDEIKNTLESLNKRIQTVGSKHKKILKNFEILNRNVFPKECNSYTDVEQFRQFVRDDFEFRDLVKIERKGNIVVFSLWGKNASACIESEEKTKTQIYPAEILLNVDVLQKIKIPSVQINLLDYVVQVNNSKKESVDKSSLKIKIDGQDGNNILSSVTSPKTVTVEYCYNDIQTGEVVKRLLLIFEEERSAVNKGEKKELLITIPSAESYTLNFNPYVEKIVEQLNEIEYEKYVEIIACSLRSLFEISIDEIRKSTKYNTFFANEKELVDRVGKVIQHIKNEKRYQTEIANKTLIEYSSLKNILNEDEYKNAIEKAHLAVHKSTTYITKADVQKLGKLIGVFLVVVNEMLNNSNIQ